MGPALGKAMQVEDWTISGERSGLLSSLCSYLAWLAFSELFCQPHWDNNIQFGGAEEPRVVPASRAQSPCRPLREGWPAQSQAKSCLRMLREEENPRWSSRWGDFCCTHPVLPCLSPAHVFVAGSTACWADGEGGWGPGSSLLFEKRAPAPSSSSGQWLGATVFTSRLLTAASSFVPGAVSGRCWC